MCGICGILNFHSLYSFQEKQNILSHMLYLLQHRGPDAFGIYLDKNIGLGHTRLSIIDLERGDQPIHNEDKSIWIVYNGEIFNYPELRNDLIKKGHHFYTQTDTEVIVHLYEEKGENLFSYLNGQFALAIWDKKRNKLLLARDRLGIRPLFYTFLNNTFIFASEIKAIFALQQVPREIDLEALAQIFTFWTTIIPKTIFKGIFEIPPGCYLVVDKKNQLKIERYWQFSFLEIQETSSLNVKTLKEKLYNLLLDAVKIRLRADVPVGAYLSGGLDSTIITSLIKHYFNNKLKTFSIGFSDQRFDETPYQKKAVEALKTDHQSIYCTYEDIGKVFPKVIWHTEKPVLRTAPAPLYLLSRLVRENHFKVVLTGEGADEIFAGYNIFKEAKIRYFWSKQPESKLRPLLLKKIYPYIFKDSDKNWAFLVAFFKKHLNETHLPYYSHILRWENTANLWHYFSPQIKSIINGYNPINEVLSTLPHEFNKWHHLSKAQYLEISIFLSTYLLSSQGDRMAMAHSVEGRFPFLDHRVVEFAAYLPTFLKLNGLNEKYILKETFSNLIPEIVKKRPKQPYRAPISQCFINERPQDYVKELLSTESIEKNGYFNAKIAQKLIEKYYKQNGILSERENMALVGILSTQLVDYLFIKNFPKINFPIKDKKTMRVFGHEE